MYWSVRSHRHWSFTRIQYFFFVRRNCQMVSNFQIHSISLQTIYYSHIQQWTCLPIFFHSIFFVFIFFYHTESCLWHFQLEKGFWNVYLFLWNRWNARSWLHWKKSRCRYIIRKTLFIGHTLRTYYGVLFSPRKIVYT